MTHKQAPVEVKLQVNQRGAWRNVLTTEARLPLAGLSQEWMDAAARMACLMDVTATLRVVTTDKEPQTVALLESAFGVDNTVK